MTYDNKSITLLGYILDPRKPEAHDSEIMQRLIGQLSTCDRLDSFFKCTYDLGGRWILIVDDGSEIILFNDPMGLRQVFFTKVYLTKDVWCASQPGIIAEVLKLDMDADAVTQYMNSDVYKNWDEYLWPGASTPYKEISHLLPNHYLRLATGICYRYWPDRMLETLSLEEAVDKNSQMLKGLMRSASNRFELGLAITAGWDTRLILASSKEISDRMYYFTISWKYPADPRIARKLLSKFGLRHTTIEYGVCMDDEFRRIYKRNVTTAHDLWGDMAQALYDVYPQDRVCVKGNAAEITRVRFRIRNGEEITARTLARFTTFQFSDDMANNPFVVKSWDNWLSQLGEIYNVHLLDLFYWEHWAGNFAAMTQSEWDIVQEVFTPYNCRQLLMNMLGVDEKYRDHDEPILYKELICKLWPEVLDEPVNPRDKRTVAREVRRRVRQGIVEAMPIGFVRLARSLRDRVVRQ
ncbi:MAG: hypothetical protein ACREKR_00335 [Candidatus Methylomirabilales bacterium]